MTFERPLIGAIVGYGFIAERGHVPAYAAHNQRRPRFDIVAVADVCPARRELARLAMPGVRVYESHRALLAAERELDFVDITTPPAYHAEIAHDALARGLHVLCEKPLTTTGDEARRLLQHARRARRVLYPSHNYKHAPVVKRVRDELLSGRIGRVHLVTLATFRTTHARGVVEWRPDWRRERRHSGGGIAMDHGSHTFYLAFEWLRGYPLSISATMSTLGAHDTEDNLACAIRFPNGMASAHLAWTAGMRKVIYSLHGDRGAIRVEDDELEVSVQVEGGERQVTRESVASDWMDASHVGWFHSLFDDFTDAIATGEYAGKEAQDAVRCIELINAAYSSARKAGREISLRPEVAPVEELTAGAAR